MKNHAVTLQDIHELCKTNQNDIKGFRNEVQDELRSIKTELHEFIEFTQENVTIKDELRELQLSAKEDLRIMNNKFTTMMDHFIKSHEDFKVEILALRHQGMRHEERLETVEHKLGITAA